MTANSITRLVAWIGAIVALWLVQPYSLFFSVPAGVMYFAHRYNDRYGNLVVLAVLFLIVVAVMFTLIAALALVHQMMSP